MIDTTYNLYSEYLENKIKFNIEEAVDSYVRLFLMNHSSLIQFAGRTNDDLHYSIVLNEDTMDNRSILFEFFNVYDSFEIQRGHPISEKYPVLFQFVPFSLIQNVHIKTEIINEEFHKNEDRKQKLNEIL